MKMHYLKNRQQGVTLIELLIAMVIGALLLAGVLQIFVSSKKTYRMQDNLSRIQENGRLAMNFISREIQQADFRVCYTDGNIAGSVFGSNDAGLNGSDRITLLQKDDTCVAGDAFSAVSFFLGADASGLSALFSVTGLGATTALAITDVNAGATANDALIEGIENMQILYGERADFDGDGIPNFYYVPAGSVGLDMDQVVSVRINLLVSSIDDNVTKQPVPYTFNGVAIVPVDRRLRRVFSSTVSIRNR